MEDLERQMINLDFFRGKRVFVTGHTGFKGSWLCRILLKAGATVFGYSLNFPTEPNLYTLAGLEGNITSFFGDIRDATCLRKAYDKARPEIVFHLAAQPIVRIGYEEPACTYETNVMGTVNLLECVRASEGIVRSVVIITTDKVYENKEWFWGYRESDLLGGFDPYSNSKSCAELVVHCYANSFFTNSTIAISTARAGNVIGGGDFARDRVIPDCVRAAQSGMPVILRNPYSTRPYQHVLEPLFAYLLIAQKQYESLDAADWYNVGPDDCDCVTTERLVALFCKAWGNGMTWKRSAQAGAYHEASFLKLDCTKIKSRLGWRPRWHIEDAVEKTVTWTKTWLSGEVVTGSMDDQIRSFVNKRL